jgi:predicted hotdog family 3-hydroxylacyl-ACP dehydratase
MRSRPYRRQIVEALRSSLVAGNRPVLATVLRTQGSTPLEAGAKALIAQDGSLQAYSIFICRAPVATTPIRFAAARCVRCYSQ